MHSCDVSGRALIRQENELTELVRPAVRHDCPDDMLLNTSQLQDVRHLKTFRVVPEELDAERAIMVGMIREVDARKTAAGKGAPHGQGLLRGHAPSQGHERG